MVIEEGEGEKKLRILQGALDEIHVPQDKLLDDTISQLQKILDLGSSTSTWKSSREK